MKSSFDSLSAMRAVEREEMAKDLDKDDAAGSLARGHVVACSIQDWFFSEAKRCGLKTACEAMLQILSVPLASVIVTVADNCDEPEGRAFLQLTQELLRLAAQRIHDAKDGSDTIRQHV